MDFWAELALGRLTLLKLRAGALRGVSVSQDGQPWAGLPRFPDHRSNRVCISRHCCLGVPDHQSLASCSAPGTPGNEAIPTGPGGKGG